MTQPGNLFKTFLKNTMTTEEITVSETAVDFNKPYKFHGSHFKCWQQKMLFLYDLYIIHDTAKNVWDALQNKYNIEEAGSKKFVVSRYQNCKMTNDKSVEEQYHKLQSIAHEIFVEGMQLPGQFQIAVVINKLPPAWKDFKNTLKHKTKEFSLESTITRLRIEEEARKQELNEEVFAVSNNNTKNKFVSVVLKPNGKQFKNQNPPANKNSNRNKNGNP